ncbi:MAG: hypothetical protein IPH22_16385 [Nitrosomonas sp.]|nr:hypothetical protein [Nitrosomonas sp.]
MTPIIRFDKLSEQQIWDIANPIMDNLMDAQRILQTGAGRRDLRIVG